MNLKKLICSCCGGELVIKDDTHYLCPYCKAMYEKDNAEEIHDILASFLEADKLEKLANARKILYDATIKTEYPSKIKVLSAATNVLTINPDDVFAKVVSYSYEDDGYDLTNFLPSLVLDTSTADQVYRWIMRDLSSRQLGPMSDFIQRHFEGKDLMDKLTKLEDEAEKEQEGFYLSNAPRDVFVCYSSKDMPEVIRLIDVLEENGKTCFAAFRNLRHGRGAKENYLREIEQAIDSCKMFLFVSSNNSRSPLCDAIKVELPYLIKLGDKPRIEYMLDKDDGHTAILAKKIIKEAFPAQERVHDEESLIDRVEYIEQDLKINNDGRQNVIIDKETNQVNEEHRQNSISNDVLLKYCLNEPIFSNDRKTVYFGFYPQSAVKDIDLIKELGNTTKDEKGYHIYQNGFYTGSDKDWHKYEPIKWLVYLEKDGYLYLLSKSILDSIGYSHSEKRKEGLFKTIYPNNYEQSDIRKWLNNEFFKKALSGGGEYISYESVYNGIGSLGDKYSGNINKLDKYTCFDTSERVFLLSVTDIISYKISDFPCFDSEYSLRHREALEYWTRSPSLSFREFDKDPLKDYECAVYFNASENDFYYRATAIYCGVRPAIKIKKLQYKTVSMVLEIESEQRN